MIGRRRNGGGGRSKGQGKAAGNGKAAGMGRGNGQGNGHQPGVAPRVRGAWTTPAVVVRAPDGSVVEPRARPSVGPGGRVAKVQTAPARARAPRTGPRRVPPPGVTGGVLAAPTRAVAARRPSSRAAPAGGKAPASRARAKPAASRPRAAAGARARQPAAAATGTQRLVSVLRLDRLTPLDEDARERRNARLRWLGTRVGSVAVSILLVYAVFPVRTYLNQRSDTNRAREQLEVLSKENDRLEQRAEELRDPETIEEIARRDHNLVMPGEESYAILPPPEQAPEDDTGSTPGG
ncbi:MAG TPA: septum formation initiator family protein [Acidimicrobiales bacterium]|nr:septum formation initiator family protein [Acidimicrobiales bacterium]